MVRFCFRRASINYIYPLLDIYLIAILPHLLFNVNFENYSFLNTNCLWYSTLSGAKTKKYPSGFMFVNNGKKGICNTEHSIFVTGHKFQGA